MVRTANDSFVSVYDNEVIITVQIYFQVDKWTNNVFPLL